MFRSVSIAYFFLFLAVLKVSAQEEPEPVDTLRYSLGLIADPQYCDCESRDDRFYRLAPSKIEVAIDTLNAHKVDRTILLGDIIDKYESSYDTILPFLDSLEMPFHNVLGNHDFIKVPIENMDSIIRCRLHLKQRRYDLKLKGWRFIFLDGTELGTYSRGMHLDLIEESKMLFDSVQSMPHGKWWNSGISNRQLTWLRSKLEETEANNEKVIIFCHYPVYPHLNSLNLWNDRTVTELIGHFPNIVAYVSGHDHRGGIREYEGVLYFTVNGNLMTETSNSFSILNIYDQKLEIKGFGEVPDYLFQF